MTSWRYSRIKLPLWDSYHRPGEPHQADAGNWVFFWIGVPGEKGSAFRHTNYSMTTLGLDGV